MATEVGRPKPCRLLWGQIKILMYETRVGTRLAFLRRIFAAAERMHNYHEVIAAVAHPFLMHTEKFMDRQGGN
jgi:hypothetical protein